MSALEIALWVLCGLPVLLVLWCATALVVTLIHRFDEWIEGKWWL